jgi:glycine dehydrogenase subunit 2
MTPHKISTLYESSVPGRHGIDLPAPDVPVSPLPASGLRTDCNLPELSQIDVVRHYLALSQRNFGVDTGFYPLGSCTMKFNPKINEQIARFPGFADTHPLQEPDTAQGNFALMYDLQQWLAEIGGFAGVSLQPSAGAHGEFMGLLMMRAYHRDRGDTKRARILIPDSAHGTNNAMAWRCRPSRSAAYPHSSGISACSYAPTPISASTAQPVCEPIPNTQCSTPIICG